MKHFNHVFILKKLISGERRCNILEFLLRVMELLKEVEEEAMLSNDSRCFLTGSRLQRPLRMTLVVTVGITISIKRKNLPSKPSS